MKAKKLHFIAAAILAAIVFVQDATAQLGMDYDTGTGPFFRFSRLRKVGPSVSIQDRFNEKAIGVYPGPLVGIAPLPTSALEVNTNFTHFPAFLSTWYNRGEVFRTDCPVSEDTYWRMFRGGVLRGHLFNLSTDNFLQLEATQNAANGGMLFHVGSGAGPVPTEKLRISHRTDDRIFAFRSPFYGQGTFTPASTAKFNIYDRNTGLANTENSILLRCLGRGFDYLVDPNGNTNNFILAEFIQNRDNTADGGIRIEGSRAFSRIADAAFIDLANYDLNNGGLPYVMSRIAAGMAGGQQQGGTQERGNFRIYTNEGLLSNTPGMHERLRISWWGNVGIGEFTHGGSSSNKHIGARLDIDGDLRIRSVTQDQNLTHVLVIDPADTNRVHWKTVTPGIGACNTTPTTFSAGDHGAIDLGANNNNFYFIGNGSGQAVNNVIIGNPCSYLPQAKLDVLQSSGVSSSTGLLVKNDDPGDLTDWCNASIGIKSVVNTSTPFNRRIAGWFEAQPQNAADKSLAIYVPKNGGQVSIGYNCNSIPGWGYLLEVAGDLIANSVPYPSDAQFKTNISQIVHPLEKVRHLTGYYFHYDTLNFAAFNFPAEKQIGFIAQQVDTVVPEVVKYDVQSGYYSLDYSRLSALLAEAIKALDERDHALQTQIDSLIALVTNCCNMDEEDINARLGGQGSNDTLEVQLISPGAILYQNVPNPFGNATLINFYLPRQCGRASMRFYDNYGRLVKELEIAQRGNGSIRVDASDLANGIYTYSLRVDGQTVDTRKMLRNR